MNAGTTNMTAAAMMPAGMIAGQTWMDGVRHLVAVEAEDGRLAPVEMVRWILLDQIDPSPLNRQHFDPKLLKEMEDSLREHGQTTPAIVRPKPGGRFELVAGERRFRASKAVGRESLLCLVREYTDTQAAEILLIENLRREDLGPMEEARIYQRLLDLRDDQDQKIYTLQKIALRVHDDERKTDRVARVLTLLQLPEAVRKSLEKGEITMMVAFLVGRIADPKDREQAGKDVLKHPHYGTVMTVEQAKRWIAEHYQVNLKGKSLDREDPHLLSAEQKQKMGFCGAPGEAADGSCERCPFLAKNHVIFAQELASGSKAGKGETGVDPLTCTRAPCYKLKEEAAWQKIAQEFLVKQKADKILPLDEGGQKLRYWNSPWIFVLESPPSHFLGDVEGRDSAPTWKKILKGTDVPFVVGADGGGKPVLLADKALAVTAAKQSMPALFAEVEIPGQSGQGAAGHQTPEQKEAAEEAERLRLAKVKLDHAVTKDLRLESLQKLRLQICRRGAGVEILRLVVMSQARPLEYFGDYLTFLDGQENEEDYLDFDEHKDRLKAALETLGQAELVAMCALTAVWDDLHYSTASRAEDFGLMCQEMGLDLKALEQEIRRRHEADFARQEKERKLAAEGKAAGKMRSKGGKGEVPRKTELANEDLAKQGILKQGDAERAAAPSHVGPGMFGRGPQGTVTGDTAEFGEMFPELKPSFSEELMNRCRQWKLDNPGGTHSRMAEALEIDIDLAFKIGDALIDEKHDGLDAARLLQLPEEAKVKAFAEGKHTMTELIGPKPDSKQDHELYKTWNAQRMRIERKAKKVEGSPAV